MSNFQEPPQLSSTELAMSYSPLRERYGEYSVALPPNIHPNDLTPEDAAKFGTILRVAELTIARTSSHAIPDTQKTPALEEISRLRELFPAPLTPLERDMQRIGNAAGFVGRAVAKAVIHPPAKKLKGFTHKPRHAMGGEK